MTLAEAGAQLGLSPSTLRNQVKRGRLRAKLVGKTWTVTEGELARYAKESQGKPGRRNHTLRCADCGKADGKPMERVMNRAGAWRVAHTSGYGCKSK